MNRQIIVNKIFKTKQTINRISTCLFARKSALFNIISRHRSDFPKDISTMEAIYDDENVEYRKIISDKSQARDKMAKCLFYGLTDRIKSSKLGLDNDHLEVFSDNFKRSNIIKLKGDYQTIIYADNNHEKVHSIRKFAGLNGYKVIEEVACNEKFVKGDSPHIFKSTEENLTIVGEIVTGNLEMILKDSINCPTYYGRRTYYKLLLHYIYKINNINDETKQTIKTKLHNVKPKEENYMKVMNEIYTTYNFDYEELFEGNKAINQFNFEVESIIKHKMINNIKTRVVIVYLFDGDTGKKITKLRHYTSNVVLTRFDINCYGDNLANTDSRAMFDNRNKIKQTFMRYLKNVSSKGKYLKEKGIDNILIDGNNKIVYAGNWNYFKTISSDTINDYFDYLFDVYYGFDPLTLTVKDPFEQGNALNYSWEKIKRLAESEDKKNVYVKLFSQRVFVDNPKIVEKTIDHEFRSDATFFSFYNNKDYDYDDDHESVKQKAYYETKHEINNCDLEVDTIISKPVIGNNHARIVYGFDYKKELWKTKTIEDLIIEEASKNKDDSLETILDNVVKQDFYGDRKFDKAIIKITNNKKEVKTDKSFFVNGCKGNLTLFKYVRQKFENRSLYENYRDYNLITSYDFNNSSKQPISIDDLVLINLKNKMINDCKLNPDKYIEQLVNFVYDNFTVNDEAHELIKEYINYNKNLKVIPDTWTYNKKLKTNAERIHNENCKSLKIYKQQHNNVHKIINIFKVIFGNSTDNRIISCSTTSETKSYQIRMLHTEIEAIEKNTEGTDRYFDETSQNSIEIRDMLKILVQQVINKFGTLESMLGKPKFDEILKLMSTKLHKDKHNISDLKVMFDERFNTNKMHYAINYDYRNFKNIIVMKIISEVLKHT